jgi:hypothetical protein
MSLIFLAEAQPRLDTGEGTLHFLGDRTNYKAKDTIEKITFFFIVHICYELANKNRNLLFAIHLLIYIIYGDRAIIGFVGFLANLLNKPIDGATVSVRKKLLFVLL